MSAAKPQQTHREPWHPADWEPADATALQALERGEADKEQQQRALRWIMYSAAMLRDEPFVPDRDDIRSYLLGRQNVARQIAKLLSISVKTFIETKQ